MRIVENVFEIAESFMKDPKYITLNTSVTKDVGNIIKHSKKPTFRLPEIENPLKTIVIELVAAAINYCYWYGRFDVRPNGANSTRMYECVLSGFFDLELKTEKFSECIERTIKLLAVNRFPLLEERVGHLRELKNKAIDFCMEIDNRYTCGLGRDVNIDYLFRELVELFPGFASDIFLKRASLFFIQLYRRFGWFDEELKQVHVPADYQIPKMLEYYGCFEYSPSLQNKILNNQLIQKGSLEECEIRAATILTMRTLCNVSGWNVADVDTYFFTQRDMVTTPFHTTITTDY